MPTFLPEFGASRSNVQAFTGVGAAVGTFQPTAQGSSTVIDANVPASANIIIDAANAAAGLLLRTKTCSVATGNSAGSFVFSVSATALGAPTGSETFNYFVAVENP